MDENENRLTKVEESCKSAHHRIDELSAGQTEIRELALSVNSLAMSVKQLCSDVTKMDGRIGAIESKPGKNWEKLTWALFWTVLGGVIAYTMNQIIGG